MRFRIRIVGSEKKMSCPRATQDLKYNTNMRDKAIKADYIQYGPLNLADEEYYVRLAEHWKTTPDVAKKSKCANCAAFDITPQMIECGGANKEGTVGYCKMHDFGFVIK